MEFLARFGGLYACTYSFTWLLSINSPTAASFGWHFQYLTVLGLLLTAITLLASMLNSDAKQLLLGVTVPVESLVTSMYWSLALYDPALVVLDASIGIPLLVDLCFHLFPFLAVATELFVYTPEFKASQVHVVVLSVLSVVYGVWAHVCFYMNGYWIYPFLTHLSDEYRIGFFVVGSVLGVVAYGVAAQLHARMHNSKVKFN
jgi:hypothetical protein